MAATAVVKQEEEEYKKEEEEDNDAEQQQQQSPHQCIIADVARSVDGLGVGLYSLVAAVLPQYSSGATAWRDAVNRNDRLPEVNRQAVPHGIYQGKVHGNRKQTHIVLFDQAPAVVKFVMKNPMEFFGDAEAHEAMVQLAGYEATESVVAALAAAESERTDAQMCLLPALAASILASSTTVEAPSRFRISHQCEFEAGGNGCLLGSIRDFIAWLGLDRIHMCNDWLEEAFKTEMNLIIRLPLSENSDNGNQIQNAIVLEYIMLPGESRLTPMTNYAGFCLILRLCAGKSAISDAMIDEATVMLGRVKVGDNRLHAEIEQNAATASAEDKAFVLGPEVDDTAIAVAGDDDSIIQQQQEQNLMVTAAASNLNATALLEAARRPNVQLQMETYWRTTITRQTEVDRQRAQAQTAEAKAQEQEAKAREIISAQETKAREATIAQEVKTKIFDENNKRQVSGASRRADIAGHKATEIGHKATESEALCRIAEAKRRLAEIVGSSVDASSSSSRRRRITPPNNNSDVVQDEDGDHHVAVERDVQQQQQQRAVISHPTTGQQPPLRGRALAALKALPPDPEFNAYRAAGIPDDAVPRDEAQSNEWYDLAQRQQLLLRPTSGVESRRSLLPRGSLDIYGQPVRPEFSAFHRSATTVVV